MSIEAGILRLKKECLAGMIKTSEEWAKTLENEMKRDRPWQDRSGDARRFLTGRLQPPTEEELVIELAQGVPYGVYLELAHEKRFAVIEPTIRKEMNNVMRDVVPYLNRL